MTRRLADVDVQPYEGLVLSTARMYVDLLDLDIEDVQQILRLKIAQALQAFDPRSASRRFEIREAERRWVFGAMRNQVKDLLKGQARLNDRRRGMQLYIEDVRGEGDRFEGKHLVESDDEALSDVLDVMPQLPSSLDRLERNVVYLLVLDLNQTEIARQLGVPRHRVRAAHESVQVKMADWRRSPSPPHRTRSRLAA